MLEGGDAVAVRQSRVGDTVTINARPAETPLAGYKDPKPMVYSGLYPIDGSDYPNLRKQIPGRGARVPVIFHAGTTQTSSPNQK